LLVPRCSLPRCSFTVQAQEEGLFHRSSELPYVAMLGHSTVPTYTEARGYVSRLQIVQLLLHAMSRMIR
jgi:hypothetical protein